MSPPLFSLFGGDAKRPYVVMPRVCKLILGGES